jgi:thiamine pyrophosphokinase
MQKALLFINGEPPKQLPETYGFDLVACSDGAFGYLKEKKFTFKKRN